MQPAVYLRRTPPGQDPPAACHRQLRAGAAPRWSPGHAPAAEPDRARCSHGDRCWCGTLVPAASRQRCIWIVWARRRSPA